MCAAVRTYAASTIAVSGRAAMASCRSEHQTASAPFKWRPTQPYQSRDVVTRGELGGSTARPGAAPVGIGVDTK